MKRDTETEKKENALDIVVNSILLPIVEGKAVELNVGKPQIYSEWNNELERGLDQWDLYEHQSKLAKMPPETMVVPITVNINSAFLQNARQTLESIAFEKKKIDISGVQKGLNSPVKGKTFGFDGLCHRTRLAIEKPKHARV